MSRKRSLPEEAEALDSGSRRQRMRSLSVSSDENEDRKPLMIELDEDIPLVPTQAVTTEAQQAKAHDRVERLMKKNAANSSNQTKGRVAESGIITRVELVNFMCHEGLSLNLGPKITFLVGHNGSGKSAVLTGIAMALGGSARSSNRAAKLSGLVRDQANYALCSVTIANEGPDAYQPSRYGRSITVERRINREGGGHYRIRDDSGRVVDTTKTALDAITDHFNIQIDNPLTVLTQDQSRQFLAGSSAKDKYAFFLRGTQLTQLANEYELIRRKLMDLKEVAKQQRDALPEVQARYKLARRHFNEQKAFIAQEDKKKQLEDELIWAHIVESERNIEKLKENEEEARTKYDEMRIAIKQSGEEKRKLHEEKKKFTRAKPMVKAKIEEAIAARDKAKQEHADAVNQVKKTEDEIYKIERELANIIHSQEEYETRLRYERERLDSNASAERQRRMHELDAIHEDAVERVSAAESAAAEARAERAALVEQRATAEAAERSAERRVADYEKLLASLRRASSDRLNVFGEYVPQLVKAIAQETRWHTRPVGPIGLHVSVIDTAYTDMLEAFFAGNLSAFVVTDAHDRGLLENLRRRVKASVAVIVQRPDDTFDPRAGEPPADIATVARVLDISHALVFQVLCTMRSIERTAVALRRADGVALMRDRPTNVDVCVSADLYRVNGGGQGGGVSSMTLKPWQKSKRLTRDVSAQIAQTEALLGPARAAREAAREAVASLRAKERRLTTCAEAAARDRDAALRDADNADRERRELADELANDAPDKIRAHEASLAQAMANRREKEAEAEAARASRAELSAARDERAEAVREAEAIIVRRRETEAALIERMQDVEQKEVELVRRERDADEELARLAAIADEIADERAAKEETLADHTAAAQRLCERPPGGARPRAEIERSLAETAAAITAHERRVQRSSHDVVAELHQATEAYKVAQSNFEQTAQIHRMLRDAYRQRIEGWELMRAELITRAQIIFSDKLNMRGFSGGLVFDVAEGRLELQVRTGRERGSAYKQTKALSGGEKSYSQLCLVLALWDCVGCRIRCLDEFDVFMDSVVRRISMKLLIETAEMANDSQFLFITPNDLGSFKWGDSVHVCRMPDPTRSDGVLRSEQV